MSAIEHETDVSAARRATRGLVRKVLLGTLLGALVLAALSLYADVSALGASLGAFDWSAFAVALALATGNYALRYVRWQLYLRRIDVAVPHAESALVFLSGFVMSVTPGKLGEVFKSLLLYESRGVSIAKTAPVVFAERLTDLVALVILTALGSLSFAEGVPIAVAGALVLGSIPARVRVAAARRAAAARRGPVAADQAHRAAPPRGLREPLRADPPGAARRRHGARHAQLGGSSAWRSGCCSARSRAAGSAGRRASSRTRRPPSLGRWP
ncbi:MAG: flippase-like domain-containing protein [Sandaracinaceae bacterium]|nr:flippase-like domain-containing protein [Sandaracinaceae bacterium]